ncbi:hypothetical protein CUJ86_02625 [Methanofollis fontis]|uniref:DUF4386 family protein n=2 Tax=Methanofollis fontis TaxID=2052832 RepID=A0A483CSM3_9EURY|nr:hypothetical protein CUJ86_02625 [Methanofollis fontis]
MVHDRFTRQHRLLGTSAAWAAFLLLIAYAVTLALGLLSLGSPEEPIGDPYFSLMEVLIIMMAPSMVAVMVAVHAYASPGARAYSGMACACMLLLAGITSGVHFVILTVSRQIGAAGFPWAPLLFSFEWPSVAYALDILAWDVFFALSMLFAAPVFRGGRLETAVRYLMIAGGALSLAGLIGVPLADMGIRNIGILGYVGFSLAVFPLLGVLFRRAGEGK